MEKKFKLVGQVSDTSFQCKNRMRYIPVSVPDCFDVPQYIFAFGDGYNRAERDLGWHSVNDCLPPIDEDVIVLTDDDGFTHPCPMKICFAHLVNSDVTITVGGKPYKPQAYNGWNIPGVKFWMPMPEIPKEEAK